MTLTADADVRLSFWRPLYWEPVVDTGERIMVGVVYSYRSEIGARKTLRSDVLSCLYGKSSIGIDKLIDHAIGNFSIVAQEMNGISEVGFSMSGIHAGPVREVEVSSLADLLQVACLMCSSLASLDKLDELEESDAPRQDQANKWFSTEVRESVASRRADLVSYFGSSHKIVDGGRPVRFGFFSSRAIIHFSVLHPTRQSQGIRDSRARLFELREAKALSGVPNAALIVAVSRDDDATLGSGQRKNLKNNRVEMEREADAVGLRWHPVHSPSEGAMKVIELAGS